MALMAVPVRRLPLSSALICLAVGWAAAALHAPLMRWYRHWRARGARRA